MGRRVREAKDQIRVYAPFEGFYARVSTSLRRDENSSLKFSRKFAGNLEKEVP
jgi:hypothetical protein